MKIAILGWGSLLWDKHADFDNQHGDWLLEGPYLKLEFSRISNTRKGALTLVLDDINGKPCQVAYTFSKRRQPDDVICDLRCREGTTIKNIGFFFADGSRKQSRNECVLKTIENWASDKDIDVVIWTDLESNFQQRGEDKQAFSIVAAFRHIQALDVEGKKTPTNTYRVLLNSSIRLFLKHCKRSHGST